MESVQQSFLSIESAIRGGSIALFSNGALMASHVGSGDRSRSEDLLSDIAQMLETCGFDKQDLDSIVVSRGPGSFTGIRIGLATAMGLGDSLGVPLNGVELFDLVFRSLDEPRDCMIVVPVGRNDVAWQHFAGDALEASRPQAATITEFLTIAFAISGESTIYCHPAISEQLRPLWDSCRAIETLDPNLAAAIGNAIIGGSLPGVDLRPLYISNSTVRS